jgi:hypothetical protein
MSEYGRTVPLFRMQSEFEMARRDQFSSSCLSPFPDCLEYPNPVRVTSFRVGGLWYDDVHQGAPSDPV